MMALLCATSPTQETVISPIEEGKNEATDTNDMMERGRVVMIIVRGITDEIRIEVTDRDREIEGEGIGADHGMGT